MGRLEPGRQRARAAALTLAVLALTAYLSVPARARAADTSRLAAQQRAALARLDRLTRQVARATRRYDAAFAQVGVTVTAEVAAQRALDEARRASERDAARAEERVRRLYISGGSWAWYGAVLTAGDVGTLTERAVVAERAVAGDAAALAQTRAAAAAAARRARAAGLAVRRTVGTQRDVAVVAGRLDALLAEAQRTLERLSARLRGVRALELARARFAAARGAVDAVTTRRVGELRVLPPPAAYLALYRAAAPTCPGLSWTVLAAIGQVESGHGRDTATSYAGAMGPMQFMPATFAAYGVDGDGDGRRDIMNPADAIFSAAAYLCANGAGSPATLPAAVFRYNNAGWYVRMVLTLAGRYAAAGGGGPA